MGNSYAPLRADSDRSWTVPRSEIEAKNYDLKAVNPNAKSNGDKRTPEELLDIIETKGKEVAEACGGTSRLDGNKLRNAHGIYGFAQPGHGFAR